MPAALDFETPTRDERRAAVERPERERLDRARRFRGPYLNHEACTARYPRLARAIRWSACLTPTEAGSALREHREGWIYGGCEAVAHFGGPLKVVQAGFRARHVVRRIASGE